MQQKESIDPGDDRADIVELQALAAALAQVDLADFSKYQQLLQLIHKDFQWTGKNTTDRLVIFTGRLATLRFLQTQLAADLQLKPQAIAILDGGMADVDQVKIVEEFGQEKSPVRILIATEVNYGKKAGKRHTPKKVGVNQKIRA
ncbi:hypothetical protein PN488_16165 [Nodularia spumigena CS-591/12]|uniref:hypothetical protein n=1 Tax=Cyanophyceae TaxID=3028117 RepID=UPI0023310A31|nr:MULTISPECIES: hypothetical protein [Cyanophyceae]MDB9305888.1 hypothetical protein [Nodularia spumigena CS-591/12]MDB9325400.1 hypothetical protein [Nodularia spumigena CS-590/02]MDB9335956.1 hypothetical protein [Nodularia spumigena CS-590/01]MDB9401468.1 hypothetical protein [Microcystis aeruginosa CS-567/02-A1]